MSRSKEGGKFWSPDTRDIANRDRSHKEEMQRRIDAAVQAEVARELRELQELENPVDSDE